MSGSVAAQGTWTVGVDCGEQRHRIVVLDEHGERRGACWVSNKVSALETWLGAQLAQLPEGFRLRIATEGIRSLGGLVMQTAMRFGVVVWQVHSKALNRYREAEGQPRKDDDTDAFLLARMVFNRVKGCHLAVDARPEEKKICRLFRLRHRLVGQRTTCGHRLRSTLLELCPEVVADDWIGPTPGSQGLWALMAKWPAFMGLERARVSTIEKLLRKATRQGDRCAEMAVELKRVAADILMDPVEQEAAALEVQLLVREHEALSEAFQRAHAALAEAIDAHPIALKLLEIPGVGIVTAAALIGEALPLARHTTEGKLATYAGCTPLSRTSSKLHGRSRLARGVNKFLTGVLFQSAVVAARVNTVNRRYYDKKRADYSGHPRPHTAATIALQRQRFKVMFRIMTTDATYDEERLHRTAYERELRQQQNANRSTARAAAARPACGVVENGAPSPFPTASTGSTMTRSSLSATKG